VGAVVDEGSGDHGGPDADRGEQARAEVTMPRRGEERERPEADEK
jgi:hypothetical protein